MKITNFLIIIAAIFLMLGTACQKSVETNKVAVNQPIANTAANTNQPTATKPEADKIETDKSTTVSLATPTDAYKAAYSARQKKDIEGLKKVLSKDALEFFTEMGKGDGKTLDDGLKQLAERPQAATAETRNEKIYDDTAKLEYLDEKGKWSPMDFVKEGSDWKLTIPRTNLPISEDKSKEQK